MSLEEMPAGDLVPLPAQPRGVPWPADGPPGGGEHGGWPTADLDSSLGLEPLVDELFEPGGELEETLACVVVHRGCLVSERYGGQLEHFDRPPEIVVPGTRLLSWSVAKSVLHAVVGVLVADGLLDPAAPAPVPRWQRAGDGRAAVTLEDLLTMRDGLGFVEEYVDGERSDVIEMLFGTGSNDVASYAEQRPLAAPPGTRFNYSSGTSNIVSGIVARTVGRGDLYAAFLDRRVFGPLGMTSASPTFDEAGTWVASSYLHATATEFARFGYLYLRDGIFGGARILPEGWVDHGRRPRSVDPEDGQVHGAHWWAVGDRYGSFWAAGYEGQSVLVVPALDLVVVRLGRTPSERAPALASWRARVTEAFAAAE